MPTSLCSTIIQKPNQNPKKVLKNNGLGTPIVNPNSLAYKLANRQHKEVEFYTIPDKDISEFLENIEKKERESVVVFQCLILKMVNPTIL